MRAQRNPQNRAIGEFLSPRSPKTVIRRVKILPEVTIHSVQFSDEIREDAMQRTGWVSGTKNPVSPVQEEICGTRLGDLLRRKP